MIMVSSAKMKILGYRQFYALLLLSLPLIFAQPKLNIKIPDSRMREQEVSEQLLNERVNDADSCSSPLPKHFFKQDSSDHLSRSDLMKPEKQTEIDLTELLTQTSDIEQQEMVKDWMDMDHQSLLDELATMEADSKALEKERKSYKELKLGLLEEYQRLSREFESIVLKEATDKNDFKKKFLKVAKEGEPTDAISQNSWKRLVKKVRLSNPPHDKKNWGLSQWARFIRFIYWKTLKIFSPTNFRRKKALKYLDQLELTDRHKGSDDVCIALKELIAMNDEGLELEDRFNIFIISLYEDSAIENQDHIVTELTQRARMHRNILPEDAKSIISSHKRLLEQGILNLNFSPRNEIEVSLIDSLGLETTLVENSKTPRGRKRFILLKSKESLFNWMRERLSKTNWILDKVGKNLDLDQDETFTVWRMLEDLQNMANTSIELTELQRDILKWVLKKVGFNDTFINLQKAELYLIEKKNSSGENFDKDSREFLAEIIEYILSCRPNKSCGYQKASEDLIKEFVRRVDKRTGEHGIIVMKTSMERLRKDLEGLDQLKMMELRRKRTRRVRFEPSARTSEAAPITAPLTSPLTSLTAESINATMKEFKDTIATMKKGRDRIKDKVTKSRFAVTGWERQEIQYLVEKASSKIKAMGVTQLAIEMLQVEKSKDFMIPIRKESASLLTKLLKDEKLSRLESLAVHSIAQDFLHKVIGRMNDLELAFLEMSVTKEKSYLYDRLTRNCLTVGEIYVLSEAQERSEFVSRKEWLAMLWATKDKQSLTVVPETLKLNGIKGYKDSMNTQDEMLVLKCAELVSEEVKNKIGGSVNVEQVSELIGALGFGRATELQLILLISQLKETELKEIQQVYQAYIVDESASVKEAYEALLPIFQRGKRRLKISKETVELEVMRKNLVREETDLQPQPMAALNHFNLVDTWKAFLNKQLGILGLDTELK